MRELQVDPVMAERMATWVVWAVINSHRKMDFYMQSQQQKEWPKLQLPDNAEVKVIVLGNGVMGSASAMALHKLGVMPCSLRCCSCLSCWGLSGLRLTFVRHHSRQHCLQIYPSQLA